MASAASARSGQPVAVGDLGPPPPARHRTSLPATNRRPRPRPRSIGPNNEYPRSSGELTRQQSGSGLGAGHNIVGIGSETQFAQMSGDISAEREALLVTKSLCASTASSVLTAPTVGACPRKRVPSRSNNKQSCCWTSCFMSGEFVEAIFGVRHTFHVRRSRVHEPLQRPHRCGPAPAILRRTRSRDEQRSNRPFGIGLGLDSKLRACSDWPRSRRAPAATIRSSSASSPVSCAASGPRASSIAFSGRPTPRSQSAISGSNCDLLPIRLGAELRQRLGPVASLIGRNPNGLSDRGDPARSAPRACACANAAADPPRSSPAATRCRATVSAVVRSKVEVRRGSQAPTVWLRHPPESAGRWIDEERRHRLTAAAAPDGARPGPDRRGADGRRSRSEPPRLLLSLSSTTRAFRSIHRPVPGQGYTTTQFTRWDEQNGMRNPEFWNSGKFLGK